MSCCLVLLTTKTRCNWTTPLISAYAGNVCLGNVIRRFICRQHGLNPLHLFNCLPQSLGLARPSRPVELHHQPLTEPCMIVSHHTARASRPLESSQSQTYTLNDSSSWLPSCCLLYTSPSPRDGLLSRMPS